MRARGAYISSFGTTTILVAAALLMLALVSALVAFKGFPGESGGSGVRSVPLAPPASTVRPAAVKRAVPARTIALARRAARPAPARVSTAGLVKAGPTSSGTARVVPGLVMVPVSTVTMVAPQPAQPPAAQQGSPQTIPTADPNPSTDPVQTTLDLLPDSPLPPPPAGPTPAAEDVTAMVGSLLGSVPPPPVVGDTGLPVDVTPAPTGVTVHVGETSVSIPLP